MLKLFVEPSALRSGTGKALLAWATDVAKKLGATRLTIEADPDAAPFYRRMGAYDVGQAPSGSVPGRMISATSTPRSRMGLRETTIVRGATVPRAQQAKS